MKTILVTGGAGYIGSHTCVELLNAGYDIVVLDNLSNSSVSAIDRVELITNKHIEFVIGDVRDENLLHNIFLTYKIDAVIHFAGLKSVNESIEAPLDYYNNNVSGTLCLTNVMKYYSVRNIIFSSSAAVYGAPENVPISETSDADRATTPYGKTKRMCEIILDDLSKSNPDWNMGVLRYFNPVGAHSSGMIGEDPKDTPNNLMPYITQVASGKLECLNIFGNDYPTFDGTGVRDYIHVVDLAKGHVAALKKLRTNCGSFTVNLGTGMGYSVLQMVQTFDEVNKVDVTFRYRPRRDGDVAVCYADIWKAKSLLGWTAELTLEDMCRDAWNWQSKNPNGYPD